MMIGLICDAVQEATEARPAQNGRAGGSSAKRKAPNGTAHANGQGKHARQTEDAMGKEGDPPERRKVPAKYTDKSMEAEWSD